MLPLLERHMRDADCIGGAPPGACVLVAQSEQDGGIGGTEGSDTGRKFITVLFGRRGELAATLRSKRAIAGFTIGRSPSPDGGFYLGAK